MTEIIQGEALPEFSGCDFVLKLEDKRKHSKIKLLQLTDMQVIDSSQVRTPVSLQPWEIYPWAPENFDVLCGNHIRSLVAQTNPDLIFITGDIVYGRFDDKGTVLEWFCSLMDSFKIPWAPVFGNHDNESAKGVEWQCRQFEKSKYCLFKRGNVSGNSNYTVGIAVGDTLVRVLHMLDSNGCRFTQQPDVIGENGILPDQVELIRENTRLLNRAQGKSVPAFVAFHIPTQEFEEAEEASGYKTQSRIFYTIGVDAEAKNGDFGCKNEKLAAAAFDGGLLETFKQCNVEAVFAGHYHRINTCIEYENIKWVFGLKTGQYDHHIPGQLGGTLVNVAPDGFEVYHVPSLAPCGPYPVMA